MKIFICFVLFLITLSVGLLLAAKGLNEVQHIKKANDFLHHFSLWVMLWRYALMLIFIGYYPKLIRVSHQKKTESVINQISHRWIAVMICVLYELIIVHNVLGLLVTQITRWLS